MIDRPILFSAPMIRAIIREIENPGTGKTETRRILKPQPPKGSTLLALFRGDGQDRHVQFRDASGDVTKSQPVRFATGDRLWVREAWKPHSIYDRMPPREMPPSKIFYLADDGYSPSGSRGRPGIHMPRWASRITLIVEDVKVERLQEISEDSAMREGAAPVLVPPDGGGAPHVEGFRDIWTAINGAASWDANPWVVAIRFRPYLCNIDQMKDAA